MDTLTHALSGALLARATAPSTPDHAQLSVRARMAVGFLAAAFPDLDFVASWIDTLTYLNLHRGITHSIIMLPFWALGLAFLFSLIWRGKRRWRAFWGVCALGIGVHILGDVITAYGTRIFSPVSDVRVSLPITFIIDPYFTAIIIVGLASSALWRSRRAAIAGLFILAGYLGFQGLLHYRALAVGEAYAGDQGLNEAAIRALPQPLSPFNWKILIIHQDVYHEALVSLARNKSIAPPPSDAGLVTRINASYRPVNAAVWQRRERFGATETEIVLAREAWNHPALSGFRRFAIYPVLYAIDRSEARTCVWFVDLRFTLSGRIPPFRFGTCRDNAAGSWRFERMRGG